MFSSQLITDNKVSQVLEVDDQASCSALTGSKVIPRATSGGEDFDSILTQLADKVIGHACQDCCCRDPGGFPPSAPLASDESSWSPGVCEWPGFTLTDCTSALLQFEKSDNKGAIIGYGAAGLIAFFFSEWLIHLPLLSFVRPFSFLWLLTSSGEGV